MLVPWDCSHRDEDASNQRPFSADLNSQITACAVSGATIGACYGYVHTLKGSHFFPLLSFFTGAAVGPAFHLLYQRLDENCPQAKVLNAFATGVIPFIYLHENL